MKRLRRIKDQDGKAEGDYKVSLMNMELVLSNLMDTVTPKLLKGSFRKNNNKERDAKNYSGNGKGG